MRDDRQELIDIPEAARQAAKFVENLSFDEFVESELHQSAMLHSIGIVGDCVFFELAIIQFATATSDEEDVLVPFRQLYPVLP